MNKKMKQRILFLLFTVVCGLAISVSASAQSQWVKLGEKSVHFKGDKDEIKCSNKGEFSKLKIRVENNSVEFDKVIVDFKQGSSQELWIRKEIGAGEETRVLDLRGGKREIESITFYYKSQKDNKDSKGNKGNKGHKGNKNAKVEVWGRR